MNVPPLRERPEDFPVIARRFLNDAPGVVRSPEAMEMLAAHAWPTA